MLSVGRSLPSSFSALAVILLAITTCRAAAQDEAAPPLELDLTTAINLALEQNRDLLRARLNVDAAAQTLVGEKAEFSFRLIPSGAASVSSGIDAYQAGLDVTKRGSLGTRVGVGGGVARDEPVAGDPLDRALVRVTVAQPLLRRFGKLVNLDPVVSAELSLASTRRLMEQQKADVVLDVVRTYEDVLRLEGQVQAEQAFFARLDQVYRLTQARERQGRTRHVDTLRLELQRGESQARLDRTLESLAAGREDLADLLGMDLFTTFVLSAPPLLELDMDGPRESFRVAKAHRMDYAQTLEDYADSSRGIAIARRGLLPDLSVVGRYEQSVWNDEAPIDRDDAFYSVGLAADTDLIAARERSRLEGSVINREDLYRQVLIVESVIQRAVNRDLRAYRRARRELEIAESNLSHATDRARLAERLFSAGRGDSFTVSDAADGFQTAERRLLATRAEASVAAYRVLHTLGTLVEFPGDLRPGPEERE